VAKNHEHLDVLLSNVWSSDAPTAKKTANCQLVTPLHALRAPDALERGWVCAKINATGASVVLNVCGLPGSARPICQSKP